MFSNKHEFAHPHTSWGADTEHACHRPSHCHAPATEASRAEIHNEISSVLSPQKGASSTVALTSKACDLAFDGAPGCSSARARSTPLYRRHDLCGGGLPRREQQRAAALESRLQPPREGEPQQEHDPLSSGSQPRRKRSSLLRRKCSRSRLLVSQVDLIMDAVMAPILFVVAASR